jgi:NitT/TauT family transport system substrate-binding protein
MPMENHDMKRYLGTQRNFKIVISLLVWMIILLACFRIHAEELKKINFMPMWLPQPQFAGFYMAREKGIYEKHELDVTILERGYNEDVLTHLVQEKSNFGIMNLLTAIEKRASGEDIVNVGQVFQRSAIEFVARKTSGINTPRDFNGRKIAVWRTVLRAQTLGFLKTQSITAKIFPVDEGISFFLKGAVDIIPVMRYNGYNTLINHGINAEELTVFRLKDFDMDFPEDGIYCLSRTYQADPELVRRFVNASMEGWEYAVTHVDEAVALMEKIRLAENLITNPVHLQWMMGVMPEMIRPKSPDSPQAHLVKSDFEKAVNFLLKTQTISRRVSYDEFYVNQ